MNSLIKFGADAILYSSLGEKTAVTVRPTTQKGSYCAVGVTHFYGADIYSVNCGGDFTLSGNCAVSLPLELPSDFVGFMADAMVGDFWCAPHFGKDFSAIPENTQSLLWKNFDGSYGFIVALADHSYKCVLDAIDSSPVLIAKSYCNSLKTCNTAAFAYMEGDDPYKLIKDCMTAAVKFLDPNGKMREERKYPEIFEYLGWCSWDAMNIWVNEEGILEKCREFRDKGIPVKWAIIDDMWATVKWGAPIYRGMPRNDMFHAMHEATMDSFVADPERFPSGLHRTVSEAGRLGMKIGMWHPTTGYWLGFTKDGEFARKYPELLIENGEGLLLPDLTDRDRTLKFFRLFHEYFREAGAEFVKIDNQSATSFRYENIAPIGETTKNLHYAIEESVAESFGGALINCMCMANENMFSRPYSAIARCSDDFTPESREWFAHHITQCAYNSLIQGQIMYCDWDMWWSDDGQAMRNSILRALSGGPIYSSDEIGRSRPEIFAPLAFSDGRILRCDRPAVPTEDCLISDPRESGTSMNVFSTCRGVGYLAAFNIDSSGRSVKGTFSPTDIKGLAQSTSGKYAIYDCFNKTAAIVDHGMRLRFTLDDSDDCRLYSVIPFDGDFALIGLSEKFVSAASVTAFDGENVTLYEPGVFSVISEKPLELSSDGKVLPTVRNGLVYSAELTSPEVNIRCNTVRQ